MATSAKPKRRDEKATKFHWFQGASVRELYNRLGSANPDTAILEVHLAGDKMTLEVVVEGGVERSSRTSPINDSRVCPPICPG